MSLIVAHCPMVPRDLDKPLKVIVRDDGIRSVAMNIGDGAQHLKLWRGRRHDRQAGKRSQRIEPVLRGLQDDVVGDARIGIEPVGRRHLAAARKIDHQGIGHVARRQTDILGAAAIDIEDRCVARRHILVNSDHPTARTGQPEPVRS